MPNASEMQRQHEEALLERRTVLINKLSTYLSKSFKEAALKEIRKIENELGIVGLPYNGSEGWGGGR
jgi:hypothetical protein